jgi:ornithine decarboxylase
VLICLIFLFCHTYIPSTTLEGVLTTLFKHAQVPASALPDSQDTLSLDTLESFYVYNKTKLVNLFQKWIRLFPNVEPYYAIKCNPDPVILDVLANCGANFDAASPAEIDAACERVHPSRVIYANPCKVSRDIEYARSCGIQLTTFDNISEYEKIRLAGNDMNMLLRIYANDTTAKCVLSNKYGAMPDEWQSILEHVRDNGNMDSIRGVSFHIGSGANDPRAFTQAIIAARTLFNQATDMGYKFTILDIGGGFSCDNIDTMAVHIRASLNEFEQAYPGTRYIAEPGRYFAESVANLYTKIIGVRSRPDGPHYWINDSLYGSFNCILFDHAHPIPEPLTLHRTPKVSSTIWGSTCDGMDKIMENTKLPLLMTGDWLEWVNMGAYTQAAATTFNGIPFAHIKKIYV